MRTLLSLGSCQAYPGTSVWLAHRECGYSNGLPRPFVELWCNSGLVRERNGGFRADDLPAVGEGSGPMADVRQASQKDDW
jgi:hypothetical protein